MITLSSAIEKLRLVADFTPEYEGENVFSAIKKPYERLLDTYPRLKAYPIYLEFLQHTGGAYIDSPDFSLGFFGFGGYVVKSFDEGLCLDQERYFVFGDVLYTAQPDPVYYFAFDFHSEQDKVYISPDEHPVYTFCRPSFVDLLLAFANGEYPTVKL